MSFFQLVIDYLSRNLKILDFSLVRALRYVMGTNHASLFLFLSIAILLITLAFTVVESAFGQIDTSLPYPYIGLLFPSNVGPCLTALFTCKVAVWVFKLKVHLTSLFLSLTRL
jgi:hypothetical protein